MTFCWRQPLFSNSGQRFWVFILWLCVLSHLQTLTGFYQYDCYLLSLPTWLSLFLISFGRFKKREIHVNAKRIHNISVPVSFHLNRFFRCHGTCFMKPVHALNLFVLIGTEDTIFFWKVFIGKQNNKTGSATLYKMISAFFLYLMLSITIFLVYFYILPEQLFIFTINSLAVEQNCINTKRCKITETFIK